MKNKLLLTSIILAICLTSFSQNEDDFAKYRNEHSRNYQSFKNRAEAEYMSFQDSINKEFVSHIAKAWKEYSVFVGEEPKDKPKPKILPVAEPNDKPQEKIEIDVETVVKNETIPTPEPSVEDEKEIEIKSEPIPTKKNSNISIDFFNSNIPIENHNVFHDIKLSDTDEKSVAALWEKLASDNYSNLAYQIKNIARERNLNDYASYLLIVQTAQTMLPNQPNEQVVYTVFMLNQLGFKAKIAKCNTELLCLLAIKQMVYKRSYLSSGNDKYYLFAAKPNEIKDYTTIYTYNSLMKNCENSINLNLYKPMIWDNEGKDVFIETECAPNGIIVVKINMKDIDFYNDYPHTEMQVYANAEMPDALNKDLLGALGHYINSGVSELEAVNYLLDFIYSACEYKTDGEQFGYEKPMFCEETIYYPYSDCEDNSILFSYLVRKLLGLDVVLLDYPGHIATAVKFTEEVGGSYLQLEDGKYVVCDPTYFGASAGMSMPQYQNVKLSVIELNKLERF